MPRRPVAEAWTRRRTFEHPRQVPHRAALHDAALRVVEDYTRRGVPYVLYLRSFNWAVLHGPDEEARQLLENQLVDGARRLGVNVVSIQEPGGGTAAYTDRDLPFGRRAASFNLADDRWEGVARALIADADLIVSECLFVSPGVRTEIEFAYRNGDFERMVLVLPPLGSMLAAVDDEAIVQMVPRVIYAHELGDRPLLDSFVLGDLVDRLRRIAALPAGERLRLARDRALKLRAYPVTWGGVAAGYEVAAVLQELADETGGETDDSWWLRFWWHFRRTSLLGWLVSRAAMSEREAAPGLVDGYLKMGHLQLREGEREAGRAVLRGDIAFAEQCAHSAVTLAERHGLTAFVSLAAGLLEDVERVRMAVAAHPDRVVVRPRMKPIATRRANARSPERSC